MRKVNDNSELKKSFEVKSSVGTSMPDKVVFTIVSKSELKKRRVSVYKYIL